METSLFYQLLGSLVVACLAIALLVLSIMWMFEHITMWWDSRVQIAVRAELIERGNYMALQDYWFPDPGHAAMWLCCAELLRTGKFIDAHVVRDQIYPKMLEHVKLSRK